MGKQLWALLLGFSLVACQTIDRSGSTTPHREVRDETLLGKNAASGLPRKRLVILPFLDASSAHPAELRNKAREAFIKELNRSGEVIAVDSHDLKPDALKLGERSEYDLREVAKQVQALGANGALEGKILEVRVSRKADNVGMIRQMNSDFEAIVRIRMVSARSGQEIYDTVKTVTLQEPTVRVAERVDSDKFFENNPELLESIVRDAFLDFVPAVIGALDKVAWQGRIAALSGDRIYLNVGKISGVQIGDLLKVVDEGEDVYDPEMGGHIGKVPGRLKGTLEIVSFFGNDGAIAVVHSGSGFHENDKVEMY